MGIEEGLWAFIRGQERHTWLSLEAEQSPLKVYMRKGSRYLNEQLRTTIEVANITVLRPRNGAFTQFIGAVEKIADQTGIGAVYVESILAPWLYRYLKDKRGYIVRHEGLGQEHAGADLYKLRPFF